MIRREARGRRRRRRGRRQHLRGDGEAVRQARQTIRRLARERPDAQIVVTGCAAQTEPQTFAAMPEVDRVLGNDEKLSQRASWAGARSRPEKIARQRHHGGERDRAASHRRHRRPRPRVRAGAERLRPPLHLLHHPVRPRQFALGADGRGGGAGAPPGRATATARSCSPASTSPATAPARRAELGKLVKQILKHVPELARLRLSSIDSVEADADLLDALANEPRLMPHLHLSLQAGDDLILKRMKRRHSRADAIAFCDQVRRLRPDVVFGADIIAGFPTETEAMFARSLDLVDECGLTHLHVFPFSPRPGTPAARMPQVARDVVKERARRLREKGEAALRRHLDGEIGARRRVLTERGGIGRTEQFTPVRLARAGRAGRDARRRRSPATTGGNCWRRDRMRRGENHGDQRHQSRHHHSGRSSKRSIGRGLSARQGQGDRPHHQGLSRADRGGAVLRDRDQRPGRARLLAARRSAGLRARRSTRRR